VPAPKLKTVRPRGILHPSGMSGFITDADRRAAAIGDDRAILLALLSAERMGAVAIVVLQARAVATSHGSGIADSSSSSASDHHIVNGASS